MIGFFRFLLAIVVCAIPGTTFALAHKTQTLKLIVNVPAHTPPGSQFYFTGGHETGCNWQPNCLPLKIVDAAGLSYGIELNLAGKQQSIQFKITRGSWETEAGDTKGDPLPNQTLKLSGSSTLSVFSVLTWKDLGGLGVVGDIIDLGLINSPQLHNSRRVTVLVPPSYAHDSRRRYPVIYMHDGQNLFDPATSAYGVDWGFGRTMHRMAHETGLEAIVVGVDSVITDPDTREEEYDYACKGADYAKFLIETLKPMIDSIFRTHPDRASTFTGGASMGATIAVDLVWAHPEVFSKALAFSLPVSVHANSVIQLVNTLPKPRQPIQIYVDHGGVGEDVDYKQGVVDFVAAVKNQGITNQQIVYAEFPYHDHTEADWGRRLEWPLKWILK